MRLLAAPLLSALGTCSSFADPLDGKQDCLKALNAAKAAGLPTSPKDLSFPKPTAESKKLEALMAKANQLTRQQPIRTKEILAVIEDIGKTKGPRLIAKNYDLVSGFPSNMAVKYLLKVQLADIVSLAKDGKNDEVKRKLKVSRRLVDITSSDSLMVSILVQQSGETAYYATIEKVVKTYPTVGKTLTPDLLNRFSRPSISRILQEEFLKSVSLMMNTKKGAWALPSDPESLAYLARQVKSWTTAYKALKNCKNGADLEKHYKVIAPKLDVYKWGDNEELVFGPSWAQRGSVLDRGETKRLSTLKLLSQR